MAGVGTTVVSDGISSGLGQLQHALGNVQPALQEIGDFAVSEILLGFDEERDPWGLPWVASQRALEESGKTLQDYGHLRDSETYSVDDNSVKVGSNLVYARPHQFGWPENNLPRRAHLPMDDNGIVDLPQHWVEEINSIIGDHLTGVLNG